MFKLLLAISALAVAYAYPGVVVSPVVPVVPVHHHVAHAGPVVHHHGAHAVHSHVIHHPAPVKAAIVAPVVPVVAHHHHAPHAVIKPVVPVVVPVHHAHHAVIAHH